jgi:DNA-binding Xre family transcriptional regulator
MDINSFIEENKKFGVEKYNLPNKSVIYFICEEDGLIIYVGTAVNLQTRIKEHFVRVEFYDKPIFFFFYPIDKCRDLEKKLINQIRPKYNIQHAHIIEKKYNTASRATRKKTAIAMKRDIATIMAEKNITRSELAKIMKVSRQRTHQLTSGKYNLHKKTIKKLEKALNVKIGKL